MSARHLLLLLLHRYPLRRFLPPSPSHTVRIVPVNVPHSFHAHECVCASHLLALMSISASFLLLHPSISCIVVCTCCCVCVLLCTTLMLISESACICQHGARDSIYFDLAHTHTYNTSVQHRRTRAREAIQIHIDHIGNNRRCFYSHTIFGFASSHRASLPLYLRRACHCVTCTRTFESPHVYVYGVHVVDVIQLLIHLHHILPVRRHGQGRAWHGAAD